jgi:hypothetical protein
MRKVPLSLCLALCLPSLACVDNAMPPDNPSGMNDFAAPPPEAAPLPPNTLRRSAVKRAVAEGVGAFLQRVEVDDRPVFVAGKFHGFRIAALRGDPRFWSGVDVRPGDVVTRVNGLPIEHPEDAMQALQSLEVASELRVDYERGGEARELRFAIVDDEAPGTPVPAASGKALPTASASATPPPPKPPPAVSTAPKAPPAPSAPPPAPPPKK